MTPTSLFLAIALSTTTAADMPPTPVKKSPDISSPQPVIDIGDVFQGESKSTMFVVENKEPQTSGCCASCPSAAARFRPFVSRIRARK